MIDHAGEVTVSSVSGAIDITASAGHASARTVDVPDDPASAHHVKVSSDAGAVGVISA